MIDEMKTYITFWRPHGNSYVSKHEMQMSAIISELKVTQHSEATSTSIPTLESQRSIKIHGKLDRCRHSQYINNMKLPEFSGKGWSSHQDMFSFISKLITLAMMPLVNGGLFYYS